MFLWVIVPTKKYMNMKTIFIGKDELTHTLFHWNNIINWVSNDKPHLIVPHINIDSGQHLQRIWAIKSGIYSIVAHWHRGQEAKPYHAFHIMRWYDKFPTEILTESEQSRNPYRKNLMMIDDKPVNYINFHNTARTYDGSGGCFTMLAKYFSKFRSAFDMVEKGILLFIRSDTDE